jgi:ferritin-like protein
MGSESYHEPLELLSERTRNLHRAIVSLIEELEAVDWYGQRAEAASDPELKAVLLHHRAEEIEHAFMNLEWLLRNDEAFLENARTYLFSQGPITEVEEAAKAAEVGVAGPAASSPRPVNGRSLGIGSLKTDEG